MPELKYMVLSLGCCPEMMGLLHFRHRLADINRTFFLHLLYIACNGTGPGAFKSEAVGVTIVGRYKGGTGLLVNAGIAGGLVDGWEIAGAEYIAIVGCARLRGREGDLVAMSRYRRPDNRREFTVYPGYSGVMLCESGKLAVTLRV